MNGLRIKPISRLRMSRRSRRTRRSKRHVLHSGRGLKIARRPPAFDAAGPVDLAQRLDRRELRALGTRRRNMPRSSGRPGSDIWPARARPALAATRPCSAGRLAAFPGWASSACRLAFAARPLASGPPLIGLDPAIPLLLVTQVLPGRSVRVEPDHLLVMGRGPEPSALSVRTRPPASSGQSALSAVRDGGRGIRGCVPVGRVVLDLRSPTTSARPHFP